MKIGKKVTVVTAPKRVTRKAGEKDRFKYLPNPIRQPVGIPATVTS